MFQCQSKKVEPTLQLRASTAAASACRWHTINCDCCSALGGARVTTRLPVALCKRTRVQYGDTSPVEGKSDSTHDEWCDEKRKACTSTSKDTRHPVGELWTVSFLRDAGRRTSEDNRALELLLVGHVVHVGGKKLIGLIVTRESVALRLAAAELHPCRCHAAAKRRRRDARLHQERRRLRQRNKQQSKGGTLHGSVEGCVDLARRGAEVSCFAETST